MIILIIYFKQEAAKMTGYQREIIELNKYNHELFMANKKLSYELRIMTEKKEEVIKSVSKETVVNDKSLIVII